MHSTATIFICFIAVLSYQALDTACYRQTHFNSSDLSNKVMEHNRSQAYYNISSSQLTRALELDSSRNPDLRNNIQLYTYIGLREGRMLRCEMSVFCCARFNSLNQPIRAVAVDRNNLYAGLENGMMMMCQTHAKDSCFVLNRGGGSINGIAILGEYIYAGLDNGILWRCRKYEANSCEDFTRFPNESVESLAMTEQYIFVGLRSGDMLRCNVDMPACVVLNSARRRILSLAASGGYVFAGLDNGIMWRCRIDIRDGCIDFNRANTPINAMAVIDQHIYAGLENRVMWKCNEGWADSCSDMERTDHVIESMVAFYA